MDSKDIKQVYLKGKQPCIFIRRTDAEVEAPILRPPDAKSQLTEKDANAGNDFRMEEKGTTEDEMVGWHHSLNGHEYEQTLGDTEGWGNPVDCRPRGRKQSDNAVTEQRTTTRSANRVSGQSLTPRTYEELLQLNNQETNNSTKKRAKDVHKHFSKKNTETANKHMKSSSTPLVTRELPIKTTVSYHFTPTRMAMIFFLTR